MAQEQIQKVNGLHLNIFNFCETKQLHYRESGETKIRYTHFYLKHIFLSFTMMPLNFKIGQFSHKYNHKNTE